MSQHSIIQSAILIKPKRYKRGQICSRFHGLGIDYQKRIVRIRIEATVTHPAIRVGKGWKLGLYLNGICIWTKTTDERAATVFDLKVPFDNLNMGQLHTRNEFAIRGGGFMDESVGHFYCQPGAHAELPIE